MLGITVIALVSLAVINNEAVSTLVIAVFMLTLAIRLFKGEEKPTEQEDWYDIDWCD